jgi:hypothetical protein
METYGVPPRKLGLNRLTLVASRVFVFTYYWAAAAAITALACSRWNNQSRIAAILCCVLAVFFAALGVGAVVRPLRAGFLHVTFLIGLGASSLGLSSVTFQTPWFWPFIGGLLGSVICLVLLDRVIWETERCRLRASSENGGPN